MPGSSSFNTLGRVESDTLHVDIYLQKFVIGKAYRLRNIYYDYDKSNIRDESKPTLDSLYQILIENPGITIELSSHTDSRGSDTYNQTLSQKRAESCVNYLISKGINPTRLTSKGWGETALLVKNAKTEDEHQQNRRTTFKVVNQ